MTPILMTSLNLLSKRVLIREDLNVPLKDGEVSSDARISAALPTLRHAADAGAAVMVMSHLGRPVEGQFDAHYSLKPVVRRLSQLLGQPVRLIENWQAGVTVQLGEIVVLENVRFNHGETANDDSLAKAYAALCDIFVMDAFGSAHRAQASTHGVAVHAPVACAGPLLAAELDALGRALANPQPPIAAIVGGSKVSSKLLVLEKLADRVDQLIVGGGIANTFLAASGKPVGRSLYEADLMPAARALMQKVNIPLPIDVVVGDAFSSEAKAIIKSVDQVQPDDMIFDIGPISAQVLVDMIGTMGTMIWNGPVGVFEFEQFANGTQAVGNAIANSSGFSLAGGGDTLAAIEKYRLAAKMSYISTGGGAFLEYVEGKVLPALDVLVKRAT